MLTTLYRLSTQDYWEAWEEAGELVVHWGKLGTPGETRTVALASAEEANALANKRAGEFLEQGFVRADDVRHTTLMIEYVLDNWGDVEDLEKRHRLQERIEATLARTGLGICDGGSIGSGTMEVCNLVVDYQLAKKFIETDLAGTEFADYSRIYEEEHDEEDDE